MTPLYYNQVKLLSTWFLNAPFTLIEKRFYMYVLTIPGTHLRVNPHSIVA